MRFLAARVVVVVIVVLALILAVPSSRESVRRVYEDISYRIHPTADVAFVYGERHFSSERSSSYDIERAKQWLLRAQERGGDHIPYLHHELARIAFLEGRFEAAMAHINTQIERYGDSTPNSYYVRGLIEGFTGEYEAAIGDYMRFLEHEPNNWAALNDLVWVLLKSEQLQRARETIEYALTLFPRNPWLLNSYSIVLLEAGELERALSMSEAAAAQFARVSEVQWLRAYPGNDPLIARMGIEAARHSVETNMHSIQAALAGTAIQ